MAYNGVQIDNSPNIIVITDSDANQITVTQPLTRTVEVAALGPQGQVGPQGPTGSMAESNSGSFSITGSLTVSGSSTFTNIGPAIFSGSVNISGSAFYNGKEILTTAISGGFVTTSSFNAFTSSINAFTASYNTGSFTGSFTGVANLTSFSASSALVTGDVTVLGTASINTLIVNQTQLSTGSNQLGDAADDTQTLYGTVRIPTGSLTVTGSVYISGPITSSGDLVPRTNLTGKIGTSTIRFGEAWFGNLVTATTIVGTVRDDGANQISFNSLNSTALLGRFYVSTTGDLLLKSSSAASYSDNGYKLQIWSEAQNTGSLYITGSSTHNLLRIDSPAASSILFVTGSGNVGIGTSTPGVTLDVIGNVRSSTSVQTSELAAQFLRINTANQFIFRNTGSVEIARFDNVGNWGFGVTSPQARVHISSSTTSTPTLLVGRFNGQSSIKAGPDANGAYLSLDSNGSATIINHYVTDSVWLASGGGSVAVGHNSPLARLHVKGTGATSSTTSLLVQNANASSSLAVLDDGNVGIGLIAPSGRLHVYELGLSSYKTYTTTNAGVIINSYQSQGNPYTKTTDIVAASDATVPSEIRLFTRTSGSATIDERLRINSSGNVGIGTASPSYPLDVNGTISSLNIFRNSVGMTLQTLSGRAQLYQSPGVDLAYFDGANTVNGLTLRNTGFVGIGPNLTPSASLHISGSSGSILLEIDSNSQQNILYVSGSGNVGIGTSTPVSKLVVAGGTDTIYNDGTLKVVGDIALNSANNLNPGLNRWALRVRASGSEGAFDIYDARNSASRLFISGSGNIGIGINSPSTILHVYGTTPVRSETPSGNTKTGYEMASAYYGGVGAGLYFYPGGPSIGNNIFGESANSLIQTNLFQAAAGTMKVGTVALGTTQLYTNSLPRLTVASTGEVGIGTTSPVANLEVKGGAVSLQLTTSDYVVGLSGSRTIIGFGAASGNTYSRIQTTDAGGVSASDLILQSDSGNVGIGTTTPSYKLQVNGSVYFNGSTNDFYVDGVSRFGGTNAYSTVINNTGSVGIGTTTPLASLHISGASSANLLRIDSPASSNILYVSGSGNVGIGTSTPGQMLTVVGNGQFGLNLAAAGARLHTRGAGTTNTSTSFRAENASQLPALRITDDLSARFDGKVSIGSGLFPTASLEVSGNTLLSGSAGTGSALTVYKSGSTVMSIQGSQGELFSITDSLSGSLFSVSNISGLPILEVFSDNTVLLGSYLDPMLITTQRLTANSGSTVIYSLPTASYDGVFVDYVIRSGSNARAGQFMGMWSGSLTNFTDNSTTDFGDTTGFVFGLIVSGSNMVLTGSASTSAWTVRAGIRSI